MRVLIVKASHEHIGLIADSVRDSDREELHAIACVSSLDGLRLSLESSSVAWTGSINGSPVCMFGVSPEGVLPGVGVPWLIGTDDLTSHSMAFLRRCRPYLAEMFKEYVVLENYVDARNLTAIQWLKWLGFRLDEPRPAGPFGLPFHRFEMRRAFFMGNGNHVSHY